jgi:signal transduction histidine kinase
MQRTPPKSEKWLQYLDMLVQEADTQVQLGESILQLSRIYAGGGESKRRLVVLDELTGNAVRQHRIMAQQKDVSLVYRPFLPLAAVKIKASVLIDTEQMPCVINNLVEDAILYTPAGGQVIVANGQENVKGQVWATVAVSNTGEEIPAEDMPRIFDRLFREGNREPLSERVRKTGLRLMVAKQVVELHGGRVTVENREDVGVTFTIWLPLTD